MFHFAYVERHERFISHELPHKCHSCTHCRLIVGKIVFETGEPSREEILQRRNGFPVQSVIVHTVEGSIPVCVQELRVREMETLKSMRPVECGLVTQNVPAGPCKQYSLRQVEEIERIFT